MANKVKFGLSNVWCFPITGYAEDAETYGPAFAIPGAVNLAMAASDTTNTFYADDMAYVIDSSNSGYDGDLEIALLPEDFKTKILGQRKDDNGLLVESANDKRSEFALTFEFQGDQNATRHLFYRCSANRPDIDAATATETRNPDTDTFTLRAVARLSDKLIKASADSTSAKYATWNTAPVVPVFTPEG